MPVAFKRVLRRHVGPRGKYSQNCLFPGEISQNSSHLVGEEKRSSLGSKVRLLLIVRSLHGLGYGMVDNQRPAIMQAVCEKIRVILVVAIYQALYYLKRKL